MKQGFWQRTRASAVGGHSAGGNGSCFVRGCGTQAHRKDAGSPPNEQASGWISILMGWEYPPRAATGGRRNSKRDVSADSKRKACTPESASPWGGKEEKRSKKTPPHPKPLKAESHHACTKQRSWLQYAAHAAMVAYGDFNLCPWCMRASSKV